jgi:hypothetical protein
LRRGAIIIVIYIWTVHKLPVFKPFYISTFMTRNNSAAFTPSTSFKLHDVTGGTVLLVVAIPLTLLVP